jgi:transcriptional regulator with XRE-family HTH domain
MKGMKNIGSALRGARLTAGRAQGDVAAAAGIAASHLSLIERGLVDVRASVAQRVATALGMQIAVDRPFMLRVAEPYEDEIANRQYLLGLLAAKRISADTLMAFRRRIEELRAVNGDYPYFQRWLEICDEGPSAVAAVLRDVTEFGRYMRAVASLRPFVSQAERDVFYQPTIPADALAAIGVRPSALPDLARER